MLFTSRKLRRCRVNKSDNHPFCFFQNSRAAEKEEDAGGGAVGEIRPVRADLGGARDPREVLLRHGTLELLHQRRGPGPSHSQPQAGEHQRQGPVQVITYILYSVGESGCKSGKTSRVVIGTQTVLVSRQLVQPVL